MKHLLIVILIAGILGCKKDKEDKGNPPFPGTNNLICNPSFEINGQGSIHCWRVGKDFTTFPDTFSTVVPPNGGQFSLRLNGAEGFLFPFAETYITNISGLKIISLSAYIMSVYGEQDIFLILDHVRGGQVIDSKIDHHEAFNGWKKFIVSDTLSMQNQDSLRVMVIQTTEQNSEAYVDLIELTTN